MSAARRHVTGEAKRVVLSRGQYESLLARVEDAEDAADFARHSHVPKGRLLPVEDARRILAGEHPVKVWREHRGLSAVALAQRAKMSRSYLTEIETGEKPGSILAYQNLAAALDVTIDDLVPSAPDR